MVDIHIKNKFKKAKTAVSSLNNKQEGVKIHPTSVVHEKVHLEKGVEIGPYTTIEKNVIIGENTKIGPNVFIEGDTTIGRNCYISKGVVLGTPPQDFKYKGEKTYLKIGNNNVIREYVMINRSTEEGKATILGDNNYLMAYSHVAHNCRLGSGIVMANAAALGGHVNIEDNAILGGLVGVHQFVNIGKLSIIGGCSKVVKDVLPYAKADGHPLKIYNLNSVGLRRNNFPEEVINLLKEVFKIIFRSELNTSQAVARLKEQFPGQAEVKHMVSFIEKSKRGITK
ncbi:MAG: acyl-ACP--UDP-N-acetylglucosamine O-acyltransferase [Candidatus Ratteibacteria bacterium]|nr:acyl-ACP--UDP-N-acetylglucosamine O-acyltransferase [Candidatus Ratteibacteria bacterium]